METEAFEFTRPARRASAFAMVGVGLLALAVLIFVVDAHVLVVTMVALMLAPALWDIFRNGEAGLRLDDQEISWHSGTRGNSTVLEDIDVARLATTLDFSQRATLVLKDGRRIRIPPEALPGGRILDAELTRRGVANRRSLFSF